MILFGYIRFLSEAKLHIGGNTMKGDTWEEIYMGYIGRFLHEEVKRMW